MDSKTKHVITGLYRSLLERLRHMQSIAQRKPFGDASAAEYAADSNGYRIALRHFEQIIFGQKNGFEVEREARNCDHAEAILEDAKRQESRRASRRRRRLHPRK
jgi:hypothetical protein